MTKSRMTGNIMLLITAIVWGCAFVAQSEAMQYMGPFTFQASRSVLGAIVLLPVIFASDAAKKKAGTYNAPDKKQKKTLLFAGVCCGAVFFAASMLQQFGIQLGTGSGKAGFITSVYILIVPLLGLFLGKRVRPLIWGCVALALCGLYLLCITEKLNLQFSDLLVLACALVFGIHIIVIDKYSPLVDGVRMSCIQFAVSGVLAGICMFIFESPSLSQLTDGWFTVAYAGVMSCGVAYTLQILGQSRTDPTTASLLMSLESVFAVLGGIIIQGQVPSPREALGCVIMFIAVVAAQLPEKKARRKLE